jgi:hypothetical protein
MFKLTKAKAVKIDVGNWHNVFDAEEFCKEHFGPGGVQRDRRWFYRLNDVANNGVKYKARYVHERCQANFYFRDPRDAVWFSLKFEVKNASN